MHSNQKEIAINNKLDVEAVERELAGLWKEHASEIERAEEGALMRARALNLIVFLPKESELQSLKQILSEITESHHCRALVLVGDREANDRDIQVFVSVMCEHSAPTDDIQVRCEKITLSASGRYVVELASAATPLLIPDLPVFLWWRDTLPANDKLLATLVRAADRLVIDSALFESPATDFRAIEEILTAASDINWARLTPWRAVLADFYDVSEYRMALERLSTIRIQFEAPAGQKNVSQACLIAAWLGSRLGWTLMRRRPPGTHDDPWAFEFAQAGRTINVELSHIAISNVQPVKLTQINLEGLKATFTLALSSDGLHLQTTARVGNDLHAKRVLPIRNWSTAELLGQELSILTKDTAYEEAVRLVVEMLS